MRPRLSIRARAPVAASEATRRVMQANVGRVTTPEQRLRLALKQAHLRFRSGVRPEKDLRCTADVTFASARVCVFIDGCFWHGCPRHFTAPRTNAAWWQEKIEANRARDRLQARLLRQRGWSVLRVWEHQMETPAGVRRFVQRVAVAVTTRQLSP